MNSMDFDLGRESSLVGRPGFKPGGWRHASPGGFDSLSLPPGGPYGNGLSLVNGSNAAIVVICGTNLNSRCWAHCGHLDAGEFSTHWRQPEAAAIGSIASPLAGRQAAAGAQTPLTPEDDYRAGIAAMRGVTHKLGLGSSFVVGDCSSEI